MDVLGEQRARVPDQIAPAHAVLRHLDPVAGHPAGARLARWKPDQGDPVLVLRLHAQSLRRLRHPLVVVHRHLHAAHGIPRVVAAGRRVLQGGRVVLLVGVVAGGHAHGLPPVPVVGAEGQGARVPAHVRVAAGGGRHGDGHRRRRLRRQHHRVVRCPPFGEGQRGRLHPHAPFVVVGDGHGGRGGRPDPVAVARAHGRRHVAVRLVHLVVRRRHRHPHRRRP